MSLVRFSARTHPQQGPNPIVDDRETTWEVFNPLHERFRFTLDVAASERNAKLPRFVDREADGLTRHWWAERVWCNPPYSDIRPWVEKAWREWQRGADLIVMLLPANRTEQRWWQELIEPCRDGWDSPLSVENLAGRMRFIAHDDTQIRPNARPPFGVCLCIWSHAGGRHRCGSPFPEVLT